MVPPAIASPQPPVRRIRPQVAVLTNRGRLARDGGSLMVLAGSLNLVVPYFLFSKTDDAPRTTYPSCLLLHGYRSHCYHEPGYLGRRCPTALDKLVERVQIRLLGVEVVMGGLTVEGIEKQASQVYNYFCMVYIQKRWRVLLVCHTQSINPEASCMVLMLRW